MSTERTDDERAVEHLRDGRAVALNCGNMGSCRCGDTECILRADGTVRTDGRKAWQKYEGPVGECDTAYGVGREAKRVWALV